MSKRKRTAQPPPQKDHPPEQVKEVALMLYDEKAYRHYRIATAGRAKKRRAQWSQKKRIKVALESSAREKQKQEKVNALLKTARTGEIG